MQQQNKKITKFLLADDHSLIRQGISFLIEDLGLNFEIENASNFEQILKIINTQKIDIAILDVQFPEGNILKILPEIKSLQPEIKILMFSGIDENTQALKYLNAGATGFLSKMSDEDEIKDAILKMQNDGEYLSLETRDLLLKSMHNRNLINPLFSLTEREMQVVELYVEGFGNLEISNSLNIKQNTVSTMKKRIFEKLKIDNIVELIEVYKDNR